MKILTKLKLRTLVFLSIILFTFSTTSCEDEFTTIGGDFVNSLNLPEPYVVESLVSYNEKINSLQTNSLTNYLLGQYSSNVFGTSTTSILTQLELGETNPDFGENPVLDSVLLTLPLFNALIGENEYRVDSVFGTGGFKLHVRESNQFLRDLDPGQNGDFVANQIYYSDQFSEFENNINSGQLLNEDSEIVYVPSSYTETQVYPTQLDSVTFDTLRLAPRIVVKLDSLFFQEKILNNQNSNILVSQNSFKNFFRGVYLSTVDPENGGSMVNLNLSAADANIRLYYRSLRRPPSLDTVQLPLAETFNTYDLRFAGNIINLYEEDIPLDLSSQNTELGEELLYIKGGQGIITVIEPFKGIDLDNNGISDELEDLRQNNWLINEANLVLNVNNEVLGEEAEDAPFRIFVYDMDKNSVIIDYIQDPFTTTNPNTSKLNHLGPLTEDDDGNKSYKIRLTSYINNIINNDSIPSRLGVVVTQNVNEARILDVRESELDVSDAFIESSISTPKGTVFYGNASQNQEKKLKLQIFYTEPN
jgi:hypothetical protein